MGTITVLGAPVAMQQEVLACLGEISRKLLRCTGGCQTEVGGVRQIHQPRGLVGRGGLSPPRGLVERREQYSVDAVAPGAGDTQACARILGRLESTIPALRQSRAQKPELRFSSEMLKLIWRLYGHMARHEGDSTALLRWRDQAWWEAQQADPQGARRPERFNAMLNTERLLNQIARPWRQTAQNCVEWTRGSLHQEIRCSLLGHRKTDLPRKPCPQLNGRANIP